MKKKKRIEEMGLSGIGLKLFLWVACYGALVICINRKISFGFVFYSLPQYATFAMGDILLFIGLVILFKSYVALKEARQEGVFAVKGVYKFMRHPMYGAWIFFIIPGIAIIARSLIFLSVAFFAYLVYRHFIKIEEDVLARQFGSVYLDYSRRVDPFFPRADNLK